ncbi:MAG: hypothetical protein KJ710_04375, partial [Candidatus Omnitrophica bacterium]|nr:hypothetical protein [Candidatus Omnitrophota bacterium]
MKRFFIYLILILIVFFLEAKPYLIYAAPLSDKVLKHDPNCPYANASLESEVIREPEVKDKEGLKAEAELEEQLKKEEREEIESFIKHSRLIYEKLAKRTKECRDVLDGEFFTINSYARKAIEAKDFKSEREFIALLSDYNSVLGDLGVMQVLLDLGKSFEGE